MDPGSLMALMMGGSAFARWLTGRSEIGEAARNRAEQMRQWEEMFKRSEEWRSEDLARQQEALDFYRDIHKADWRSTTERRMPNIAASRAILGSTMQTDVPAYRPQYSEDVEREENPYGPYVYSPRSA